MQKQIALNNQVVEKIVVTADENMIEAVIRNLLVNALKFTPPGGSVTVTALHEPDTVTVSVTDTGIGIPTEHIPHLFRIDTRYKRMGTAREKGTGLRLILCKEFVEHHGGRIWVESEAAQGSTFYFTLSTRHT